MRYAIRSLTVGLFGLSFAAVIFSAAQADSNEYYPPVSSPLVSEECGGCHLAFPAAMLPASSWRRMMGELDDHFGDNAEVAPEVAQEITAYLVANAGDAAGRRYSEKLLRGVNLASAPQRISELPGWVREHDEVPDWEWHHKDVLSKANCLACHAEAERGYYDD